MGTWDELFWTVFYYRGGGVLKPYEVVVSTRTKSKLNDLKDTYPEIEITYDNSSIVLKSNLLFLFIGTSDVKGVLEEINE